MGMAQYRSSQAPAGFRQALGDTLILLVIPESRSDARDPVPLHFNGLGQSHWVPAFAGTTKTKVDQVFLGRLAGKNRENQPHRINQSAQNRNCKPFIPALAPSSDENGFCRSPFRADAPVEAAVVGGPLRRAQDRLQGRCSRAESPPCIRQVPAEMHRSRCPPARLRRPLPGFRWWHWPTGQAKARWH